MGKNLTQATFAHCLLMLSVWLCFSCINKLQACSGLSATLQYEYLTLFYLLLCCFFLDDHCDHPHVGRIYISGTGRGSQANKVQTRLHLYSSICTLKTQPRLLRRLYFFASPLTFSLTSSFARRSSVTSSLLNDQMKHDEKIKENPLLTGRI